MVTKFESLKMWGKNYIFQMMSFIFNSYIRLQLFVSYRSCGSLRHIHVTLLHILHREGLHLEVTGTLMFKIITVVKKQSQ